MAVICWISGWCIMVKILPLGPVIRCVDARLLKISHAS